MKLSRSSIIKILRNASDGVSFRDLLRLMGTGRVQRAIVGELLDSLVEEGAVVRMQGNVYQLAGGGGTVVGRLSTHREGYGFVSPEDGGDDIFIPARYLRDTMHGDQVEVAVVVRGGGEKREGRVVRVVSRAHARVVGRFVISGRSSFVLPDDQRISREVVIPLSHRNNAREGQVVVAEIVSYPTGRRPAEGRVVEVLGWPDDPEVEVRTIISKFELPEVFSPEALRAAHALSPTVDPADIRGRVDLRGRTTVTIDGETARDFDDAVSVQREKGEMIRLWVSIADVSHYVAPDSPLDRDAYLRGTSVYFPDRCIPMLPEELSNGICSLNPAVDRLTVTAEMVFDRNGDMKQADFYPSVIRSAARLTYTTVRKVLVDKDHEAVNSHRHLLDHLSLMEVLALRLMAKRRTRGSIDFDLPEPQLVLDLQGGTLAIVRAERNLAHRIIEEFMLAANEAVASFLEDRGVPSLYRVHEPPDIVKLRDFSEFIHNFGYEFRMQGEKIEPAALQALLDQAAGKPEERMINEVLLRTMKQARYSAENAGHFGLAAACYTHFTSPIRRYPDLEVHRILKAVLSKKLKEPHRERLAEKLPDVAAHCSARERVAMEAEREIVSLKKVQFMKDKLGEEYDGIITGVASFGLFVELIELFVEGMVHISLLPFDFYRYMEQQHALVGERTRRTFRIGDRVRVVVAAVSLEKKQIDFSLVPTDGAEDISAVYGDVGESYPRIPVKGKRLARKKESSPQPVKPGKGPKGKGGKGRRR